MIEFFDACIVFVKTYYQFIALGFSVLLFILDLIILGVRNRQPLLTIYSFIREWLPGAIALAEKSGLKGLEKRDYCVSIINGFIQQTYPKVLVEKYKHYIETQIEGILSLPQKKGV